MMLTTAEDELSVEANDVALLWWGILRKLHATNRYNTKLRTDNNGVCNKPIYNAAKNWVLF
jgi:hypothetical protein